MVDLIVGEKGRGKTKQLLDRVNESVKTADGSVVFIDSTTSHMLELNSKIRLIVLDRYPINSTDGFLGFLCGMISQNKDIEEVYIDRFLKSACIDVNESFENAVDYLEDLSEKFNTRFIISISKSKDELPDTLKEKVVLAL